MSGGVGVLWSNQSATDDAFYFAAHSSGAAAATWQSPRDAFGTSNAYDADGHISLKTDASGANSRGRQDRTNDDPAPNGGDPLITVLKRTGAAGDVGAWASPPVTTVTVGGTRPILVLDDAANEANVFLTSPEQAAAGAAVDLPAHCPALDAELRCGLARKPSSRARPKSRSTTRPRRSSGRPPRSGILVEATNIPTRYYLHNCVGGPMPRTASRELHGHPTSGLKPLTVQFTDTSTNTPTSWSWTFGDGGDLDREEPQPSVRESPAPTRSP